MPSRLSCTHTLSTPYTPKLSACTLAMSTLRTSKRRTHLRTVSGVGPNLSATDVIAAHCDPQCRSASNTIRTARSRNSTG